MVKTRIISLILFFVLLCYDTNLGNSCIETTLDRQLGVREATGKNDGWKVSQYLESTGNSEGQSWCASYVHWVLEKCGFKTSITAWSPSAHNPKNIVYYKGKFNKNPKIGDVFTIYSIKNKRISHTGFFRERINEKFYLTNEGNSAPDGYKGDPYNGYGVFEKVRSFNATYSITRWIPD